MILILIDMAKNMSYFYLFLWHISTYFYDIFLPTSTYFYGWGGEDEEWSKNWIIINNGLNSREGEVLFSVLKWILQWVFIVLESVETLQQRCTVRRNNWDLYEHFIFGSKLQEPLSILFSKWLKSLFSIYLGTKSAKSASGLVSQDDSPWRKHLLSFPLLLPGLE